MAEVPGRVPGDARTLRHPGSTLVRRAVGLEEVPQLGGRPARARNLRVTRPALPPGRPRHPVAQEAPRPSQLTSADEQRDGVAAEQVGECDLALDAASRDDIRRRTPDVECGAGPAPGSFEA